MFYPELKKLPEKTYKLSSFGGIKRGSFVPESYFSDMENFTSDAFPLLSVRQKRGKWSGVTYYGDEKRYTSVILYPGKGLTAVCKVNSKICCCGEDGVTFNGKAVRGTELSPEVDIRTAVPIGRNIFIVPDGVYIKIKDEGNEVIKCDVPVMDFAVERNNRIWGCRYGLNKNGEFVNEVYASELGNPENFTVFQGISTDPYTANLGCSGEFTGAAVLGNEVLFFKEEYIIRISGDTPSDFTVASIPARGVEKGAHLSVVNLNEQIFYKSRGSIMVFDSALPYCVSEELGEIHYTDAVAGGDAGKYYIAMTDEDGRRGIFVYDTKTRLWHREDDNEPTKFMLSIDGCLYFIKLVSQEIINSAVSNRYCVYINNVEKIGNAINLFGESDMFEGYEYRKESDIYWYAETGKIGENVNPSRQYIRNIYLTLSMEKDAYLNVFIKPDDMGQWEKLCVIENPSSGVFTVPVNITPCHSFRLRFEGKGEFTLYALTRKTQITSEVKGIG